MRSEHLRVVSVRMSDESGTRDNVEQLSGVQQKQQRAKDRALQLWNAEEQLDDCRQLPVVADLLGVTVQE